MGSSYQQTDDIAVCAIGGYCSGNGSIGSNSMARRATFGGSAGSASNPVDCSLAAKVGINFELAPNLSGTWKAGNWTVRVNVVGAHLKVRLDEVWICRVSSACGGLSTIGSATGLDISCETTGVKTVVVSGVQVTGASSTDKIIIVCIFKLSGFKPDTFTIYVTPSELIDTPLDRGGALTSAGAGAAAMVGRRSWRGAILAAGVGATALVGKSTKRVTLTTAGVAALTLIGRLLRRGVLSSTGVGGSSLHGSSNKPVLRVDGMGAFSPVGKSTGQMALDAAGVGAFSPAGVATIPASVSIAGVGDTAFVGASTAEATFQMEGVGDLKLDFTWEGWAQQPIEFPPNAGWVLEDML